VQTEATGRYVVFSTLKALKAHTSTLKAHKALKAHTSTHTAHKALKAHTSTRHVRILKAEPALSNGDNKPAG
jgi:hypothetical protein